MHQNTTESSKMHRIRQISCQQNSHTSSMIPWLSTVQRSLSEGCRERGLNLQRRPSIPRRKEAFYAICHRTHGPQPPECQFQQLSRFVKLSRGAPELTILMLAVVVVKEQAHAVCLGATPHMKRLYELMVHTFLHCL